MTSTLSRLVSDENYNACPKTWEPFLRHLIALIEDSQDNSVTVDEIWSLEATQHGDAALVNHDKLGAICT